MKKKYLAMTAAAMAALLTVPALVFPAFAAPKEEKKEAETTETAEDDAEEDKEEKPAATTAPQNTKPFDAEEYLETYTAPTTYDYYGDPQYDTDGNASLVSNKQVIYSSAQLQFISVTTRDGHVFYIIIDYTDTDGDNVYFLNKVDDFDMYRLLYAGSNEEEDTNVVEGYEARQGTSVSAVTGQQKGTTRTEAAQVTDAAAQQPGSGLSTETMIYLIGGGIFAVVMAIAVILKMRSMKKNRIPTDDFDEEDDDEDIGGDVEIK